MPVIPSKVANQTKAQTSQPSPNFSPAMRLQRLLALVCPVPDEWLKQPTNGKSSGKCSNHQDGGEILPLPCNSYALLEGAWNDAIKWTPGLNHAMACMLASIASTNSIGDQLWIKVIGPASCGKSMLCEAITLNREHIYAKSTIRGFHSGYKSDGGGSEEDNSLITGLDGKTLVTKDGDTLLQSPNLSQILSEARDVYDGSSRTHYRNKMSKDYERLRITWILCGTSSLRALDSSELGERFLDCVIMEGIDDELEDEVLLLVAEKADLELGIKSGEDGAVLYEPKLLNAMQLTAGYVNFLKEDAANTLSTIQMGREAKYKCARLGKFVAHMRARPSLRQEEVAEREFGARLVKQLTRMAKCLALALNKPTVDEEVLRRVTKVAMDTGRGKTLALAALMYHEVTGQSTAALSMYINSTEEKVKSLLRFLKQIGVAELYQPDPVNNIKQKPKWRLTKRMRTLYEEVIQ